MRELRFVLVGYKPFKPFIITVHATGSPGFVVEKATFVYNVMIIRLFFFSLNNYRETSIFKYIFLTVRTLKLITAKGHP